VRVEEGCFKGACYNANTQSQYTDHEIQKCRQLSKIEEFYF